MKTPSVKTLKKKANGLLSELVRRGAADHVGYAVCVTCGVKKHWKELEAGHFVAGRCNAILFDERGVHPQCGPCNRRCGPRTSQVAGAYHAYMLERYGNLVINELYGNARRPRRFAPGELGSMIDDYRSRLKRLDIADS